MPSFELPLQLAPVDPGLFFTRNDPGDPRMGDIVARDIGRVPDGARVALVGVPQDIGVERNGGRTGAAGAPDAIRAMFYRLTPYDAAASRSVPGDFLVDMGNIRCDGDLEEIHERLETVTAALCRAGLLPLVLGGGHDITYASASGVHQVHGRLGAFNFDAHLDVRPPNPLRNSGTSFRMLIDEGKLAPESFVEFGIQSFANAERHVRWLLDAGGAVMTLGQIRELGYDQALARALATDSPLYATLDIDGVRAADAPGVSATMPDGFSPGELLTAARRLGRMSSVVALDIAEMNPRFDRDNITAKLAAQAAMQFVMGVAERD